MAILTKEFKGKFQRAHNIFTKNVKGKWYTLSKDKKNIHILNPVASFIWELLEKPISVNKIVDKLTDEYEVSKERAQKDVNKFIRLYLRRKFIKKV